MVKLIYQACFNLLHTVIFNCIWFVLLSSYCQISLLLFDMNSVAWMHPTHTFHMKCLLSLGFLDWHYIFSWLFFFLTVMFLNLSLSVSNVPYCLVLKYWFALPNLLLNLCWCWVVSSVTWAAALTIVNSKSKQIRQKTVGPL